jgi:hypothetical protein
MKSGESAQLLAVLNAGGVFPVGPEYPLKLEQKAGGAAYIEVPHGLSALCSRRLGTGWSISLMTTTALQAAAPSSF